MIPAPFKIDLVNRPPLRQAVAFWVSLIVTYRALKDNGSWVALGVLVDFQTNVWNMKDVCVDKTIERKIKHGRE